VRRAEKAFTNRIFHKVRQSRWKVRYWSDFDSPSVTQVKVEVKVKKEKLSLNLSLNLSLKGRMPFENEAEMLYLPS